jgi:hypothetical protein
LCSFPDEGGEQKTKTNHHMKTTLFSKAMAFVAGGTLLAQCGTSHAQVTIYDVDLDPVPFTLYTDPYNGNQIKVGGFSGIYPVAGKPDHFHVITDRGPAPDFVNAAGTTFKTFAIPEFGPHLLQVELKYNERAKIKHLKPLTRPDGEHISGLPTSLPATDIPFDFNLNRLAFDEDSLDAEGVTMDPWGNFWVCDEYKPSVAMLTPAGTVQMRLVPAGTLTGAERVPTYDVLPAVLAKRRNNRGLEGIAASSDGILYAIMQRPANNPNRAAADANGNVRLVAINLNVLFNTTPQPLVQQYLYRIPAIPNNVTLSDLFSTAPGKLLVPERATDKLFEVDLAGATDITPLETAAGKLIADPTKTLEQLDAAGLATHGITPVTKTVVIDSLTAIDPLLEKVEGVCVVGNNIVLTYDNDFNVAEVASSPANPNPAGPLVQLELVGANFPRVYVIPMPR